MKYKIAVAMSGGVDSSVVAALLKKQGHEVFGVTMQVWQDTQDLAIQDAKKVTKQLNIPHYVLDLRDIFKQQIIEYFTSEYLSGRTPNPCIMCNRYVKFGELLKWAKSMGANYLATGHYAQITKEQNRYLLKKSASLAKDQTYLLYRLTQEQLSNIWFPLASYDKDTVRKMAKDFALTVADKTDSQDICFIADHDYVGFIKRETGTNMKEGNFVDKDGYVLGKHRGIYHYTIGQRKGLGIAAKQPLFVSRIDVARNEVVLGEESDILATSLLVKDVNLISVDQITQPMAATVKIRYGAQAVPATLFPQGDDSLKVEFQKSQRAVTAGQSAVFYQDDVVVGGGIIQ